MEDHSASYAKYPRFIHDYIRGLEESKVTRLDLTPRDGWQTQLVSDLNEVADSRKIIPPPWHMAQ